jgi:hypothetical protein
MKLKLNGKALSAHPHALSLNYSTDFDKIFIGIHTKIAGYVVVLYNGQL